MKQHPIPHNILDIEFKLFGKFTAKEFVYIAVGVGLGWVFLFLRSSGAVPGIIAWPVFIISSGMGLFLGIVPINDQKSDVFLKNYFRAITRPTRRVWRNSQFDEKLETIAQQRGIIVTHGTMDRNANIKTNGVIVGGAGVGKAMETAIPRQEVDSIDATERQELERITALAQRYASQPNVAPQQAQIQQQISAPQQQPSVQQPIPVPPTTPPQSTPMQMQQQIPVPQTAPAQQFTPVQQPNPVQTQATIQQPMPPQTALTRPQPTQVVQASIVHKPIGVNLPKPPKIVINSQTAKTYSAGVQINSLPNIPYMKVTDSTGIPISGSIVLIKNYNGSVIQAHRTNEKGFVIPSRSLENGEYVVEIQNDKYNFPQVVYLDDNMPIQPVQIKAI